MRWAYPCVRDANPRDVAIVGPTMAGEKLHPAENRAYRELYAYARQVANHWPSLARRLPGGDAPDALRSGAKSAGKLIDELTPLTEGYGLSGKPAAQGVGVQLAGARTAVRDRFLERNQAVRVAVLDAEHVAILLAYLATIANSRGDETLEAFCSSWEKRMRRVVRAARKAAIGLGENPDTAIEPLDRSAPGKAAHGAAYAIGTVGEWVDRRVAGRRSD